MSDRMSDEEWDALREAYRAGRRVPPTPPTPPKPGPSLTIPAMPVFMTNSPPRSPAAAPAPITPLTHGPARAGTAPRPKSKSQQTALTAMMGFGAVTVAVFALGLMVPTAPPGSPEATTAPPSSAVAPPATATDAWSDDAAAAASAAAAAAQSASNPTDNIDYLTLKSASQEQLEAKLTDTHGVRYQNVRTVISKLDGGTIVAFCGEENSRTPFGGYGGYQRFIASQSTAVTEANMTSDDFTTAWRQFCTGVAGPQVWF